MLFVFGGSFDPFHEGHLGVLAELAKQGCESILIAPTLKNPWKNSDPAPLDLRLQMAELVLQSENIAYSRELGAPGVVLSDFPYIYVVALVHHLHSRGFEELTWVVGPDLKSRVEEWKDWKKLDIKLYVASLHADDTRSERIRSGMSQAHPAIREFIVKHNLYNSL